MRRAVAVLLAAGLAQAAPGSGSYAQSLQRAVEGVRSGEVVFRFPVDDGVEVCDNGIRVDGRRRHHDVRRAFRNRCAEGQAQVTMEVRDGAVRRLVLEPPDTGADTETDLGLRSAEEAASFLLGLARTSPRRRVAENAILPAMIARDVVVWPELVDIARDRYLDEDVREQAVFWLGQEVADAGGRESEYDSEDDDPEAEVREAAVFAISQRSDVESVPILMGLAHTSRHSKVRRSAVFWLSQSDDDRVIDFFEEMLRGG